MSMERQAPAWQNADPSYPAANARAAAMRFGIPPGLKRASFFHKSETMKACRGAKKSPIEVRPEHVEAFKALAHPNRLRVYYFVVHAGGEVSAGEIQAALELPAPTLSHYLEALRRAGLLQSRREERFIYYSARPEMVSDLVRVLSACC
jgi:ArsR family transcriptional regulator